MPASALEQKIYKLTWSRKWDGRRVKEILRMELPALGSRGALLAVTNGLVSLEDGPVLESADQEVPKGRAVALDFRHGIHGEGRPKRPRLHDRLEVLHDDEQVVVVNKRPFTPVQPARAGEEEIKRARTAPLIELLKHYWRARGGPAVNPYLVQRLDMETSGLLVLAKDTESARLLQSQLRPPRGMKREYLAFVAGIPEKEKGRWESYIGRGREGLRCSVATAHPGSQVPRDAQHAVTHWSVVRKFREYTLLRLRLETGRTHQIRIHCAEAGHPLLGDKVYERLAKSIFARIAKGKVAPQPDSSPLAMAFAAQLAPSPKTPRSKRVALHSTRLEFQHPGTRKRLAFEAPLPPDLEFLGRPGEKKEAAPDGKRRAPNRRKTPPARS